MLASARLAVLGRRGRAAARAASAGVVVTKTGATRGAAPREWDKVGVASCKGEYMGIAVATEVPCSDGSVRAGCRPREG